MLLAGALRREKAAEETIAQQAADLEQLSRLVQFLLLALFFVLVDFTWCSAMVSVAFKVS